MERTAWIFTLSLSVLLAFTPSVGWPDEEAEPNTVLGIKFYSNLNRHGATFYNGFQVYPFLYLGWFNNRLQFFTNSLEYSDYVISDRLRLRTRIGTQSDRPLYLTQGKALNEKGTPKNSRPMTLEWQNTLETTFPNLGNLDFRWIQDIWNNGGIYFELNPRLNLVSYGGDVHKPEFQLQAFTVLGWGNANHNRYYYGSTNPVGTVSSAGFSHLDYGLQVVSPVKSGTYFPLFQFYRYQILSKTNRLGDRVHDQTWGWNINFNMGYKFF